MKAISDNEIISTSRGNKRIGALFDENAMLHTTNADLLAALEAIMADYEAWQKGDIENPMAMVNEEKAIAAIKQARGE